MLKKLINRFRNKLLKLYYKIKPFPSIVKDPSKGFKYNITHISAFNYGNAGDTILPIVLRNLFSHFIGKVSWKGIHVHKTVDHRIVNQINKSQALVIGGGGLFLKDTNPNQVSGWQWPCSIENLNMINIPIIMFAVGYNRFRGQEEFDTIFKNNLNNFVEKASFVGIRNNGSIERLKEYLDNDILRNKLIYQPCMTTVISKLYPQLCNYNKKENFIAFNCAFDRKNLRINNQKVLHSIAKVAKALSKKTKIKYYSHMKSDNAILSLFDKYDVEYELVTLSDPKLTIEKYSKPRLVIGMRGHAQMIPFGCMTPILSIISHDKMQWFLDDISHPEWGVDILDPNFESNLLEKAVMLFNDSLNTIKEVERQQDRLWEISKVNLTTINNIISNRVS